MFMIMPWVWEGSPMDAAKRFRFCTKRAFESAVKHCKKVSQEAEAKMQPCLGVGQRERPISQRVTAVV